jgi:parallel beta-helix repeat protein
MRNVSLSSAKIAVLVALIAGLLVSMAVPTNQEIISHDMPESPARVFTPSYEDHIPIRIDGNDAFHGNASIEGWDGDGSQEHPYVISGYSFVGVAVHFWIENTDLYFEFSNNFLDGVDGTWCPLALDNVVNANISSNEILNGHEGIWLRSVQESTILNNTIHDVSSSGIWMDGVQNTEIRSNHIYNLMSHGIWGSGAVDALTITGNEIHESVMHGMVFTLACTNCDIFENWIYDTNIAIKLRDDGTNTEIYENSMHENSYGVYLEEDAGGVEISGNIIVGCGLFAVCIKSDSNSLTQNNIGYTALSGIVLYSAEASYAASFNVIESNSIYNSSGFSIDIESGCTDNSVRFNDFFQCEKVCHIQDNGTGSVFSENYFDTWTLPDSNSDGYVDTAYATAGSASSSDALPKAEPNRPLPDGLILPRLVTTTTTTTSTTTTTTTDDEPALGLEVLVGAGALTAVLIVVIAIAMKRSG